MARQPSKELLRPFVTLLLGFAIINLMATAGRAAEYSGTFKKQSYAGSQDREYIVHVPDNINQLPKPAPLVVVLHGCDEDHRKIQHDTNFDAVADQEGFITLYPFITKYDDQRGKNCWGWWMPEHIHKGKGEVEDVAQLINKVQNDYPSLIDKKRTHITGVSAGAGMAVDVMVAHPELIASGATTAGLTYSETSSAPSWFVCQNPGTFKPVDQIVSAINAEMGSGKKCIPIYIVHSWGDCMIKTQSSMNLRDAWGKVCGIDTAHPVASESGDTKGTHWTHTTYGDGVKRIETLFVGQPPDQGPNHGWYGGRGDGKYTYPDAPNTAQWMWEFFKSFYTPSLTVSITNVAVTTTGGIRVEGKMTGDCPLDQVTVTVELLGLSHQDALPAQVNPADGTFVFERNGLQNNTYYRPLVTAKCAGNEQVTALGSPVALGNPPDPRRGLTIDPIDPIARKCAVLTGTARDDSGLVSVDVQIDGKNWMPAGINLETWTYKVCGLAPGGHEVTVRARDKAALDQFATGHFVTLKPYDDQQSSDLIAHLNASRVRQYPGGFGSADKSFKELYDANGINTPFFLYRATGTNDWYADTGNIPEVGGAMAPAGVAVPRESVKGPRAMPRTSERDLKPVPCPCP